MRVDRRLSNREESMRYALSFSGGKDSTLALHRARNDGFDVAHLFNIFEGSSGRVRFHGTRSSLIAAQAASIGIPLVQASTHPDDYEIVFERVLDGLQGAGIGGVIFGNLHLADIRAWYEERVTVRGLEHVEPLWLEPGTELLDELVELGYRARIVSVDLKRAPEEWLGKVIDRAFIEEVASRPSIDPSGERGEYHTFVESGPLFTYPLSTRFGERVEMEGHALLDMELA
jgi:diphthine-ammonia ligase